MSLLSYLFFHLYTLYSVRMLLFVSGCLQHEVSAQKSSEGQATAKKMSHNLLLTWTSALWELWRIQGNERNWPTVSSSSAHPPSVLLEMSGSLCNEKFSSEVAATSQAVLLCTLCQYYCRHRWEGTCFFPWSMCQIYACAAVQMYTELCWRHNIVLAMIQTGMLIRKCMQQKKIGVIVTNGRLSAQSFSHLTRKKLCVLMMPNQTCKKCHVFLRKSDLK